MSACSYTASLPCARPAALMCGASPCTSTARYEARRRPTNQIKTDKSNQTRQIQSNPTNRIECDRRATRAPYCARARLRRLERIDRVARGGERDVDLADLLRRAGGTWRSAQRGGGGGRHATGRCLADRRARVHHVGAQHLERVRGLPPVAGACWLGASSAVAGSRESSGVLELPSATSTG